MIALKEPEGCALAGTDVRPLLLRQRASRPQLKRDPLGGDTTMTIRSSLAIACAVFACSPREMRHESAQSSHADSVGQQVSSMATRPTADTTTRYCLRGSDPIRVSEDSIGPLDLSASLKRLRVSCPAAYETISYGEETANPAVAFPFDGLAAIAVQHQDSVLANQPADGWRVTGTKGLLLGRLPLTAPWTELRTAFGPGIDDGSHGLTVMFCAYPRLLFRLDAPSEGVTSEQRSDLSRIPSGARIRELEILPEPNPTWHC